MFKKVGYLLVAISLLVVSCNKDTVKLISKNFEKEVPTTGNLSFTFDRVLAPDSLLEFWDTTKYIKFEPHIDGRFKWVSQTELVFSPFNELPPSTKFTAVIDKKICQYTKYKLTGETKINFNTPYLELSQSHAYWTVIGDDLSKVLVQLDLDFNYDINPNDIAKNLKVEIDGKTQSFNLLSSDAGHQCSVTLLDVKKEDKDKEVKVTIEKGLSIYNSTTKTEEILSSKCMLISPYTLSITSTNNEHDGVEGRITIYTSQQVKEADLKSFIKLEPNVNYQVLIEKDHFMLYSEEFKPNQVYKLTLTKGLMGIIGGKLKEEYETQISFGELEPTISINNSKGFYLAGKGFKNIGVNIINVKKVKVTISKIYENNLLKANNYSPDNDYEDYNYENEYNGSRYYDDYYSDEYTEGDVIWEKSYDTKDLQKLGNMRLLNLNFEDKIKDYKGVYHIQIASDEDRWLRDSRVISISDIGLVAKKGKEYMYVFANSIQTAQPMNGVEITIIGKNNQVVGKGTCGNDGMASIKLSNNTIKGFTPSMITAKLGSDFTYLPFNRTYVNTSRFDVGGKTENPSGMECFIYPERDMYRPGETVKLATIIRNAKWMIPGAIPVKVKVLMPNGSEMKTFKKALNEQGSFDLSFEVPNAGVTGTYSVEVFTSNDLLIGSNYIRVEEFLPDRIKVTATPNKKSLAPNEMVTLNINAQNYFGPPAANNNYEVEFKLEKEYFSAKNYPSYNFSQANNSTYFSPDVRSGKKTDEKGNATETYTIPASYANMGKLRLNIFTTVFDENGRPVNRSNSLDVFTQNIFYGIGEYSYWNGLNTAIDFPLIAVDKNGTATSDKAKIQIIKYDYKTVLESNGSYYSYRSERQEKTLETKEISIAGTTTTYKFIPRTSGEYEIRVYKSGTNTYVSSSFYAYGYGNSYNSSFEVDNEGNIDISTDKDKYQVGETANILFKTPFAGKMLVTIETNEVQDHFFVETDKKTASLSLKITDKYLPNAYISATLIKPHTASEMPLTVAHGVQPFLVESGNTKIAMSITAAKSVRSKTKQTINVKGAPNSYITIAAVDEGILAMTGFETPDPHAYFYAKRALGIRSFDMYPYLLAELSKSSTGGDGYDLAKRVNPLTNKRVKLVSFWSGLVKTDGSGNASMTIDIPQFSGQLRIMTACHRDNTFGMAQASMTVADPVVLSTGLPRFISPGDTIDIPVNISNTTTKSMSSTATISVNGPLKIVGSSSQSISIKANGENTANYRIVANNAIGNAKVKVIVNNGSESYEDETEITIRPSASLQKISSSGIINGGASQTISLNTSNFIASSVGGKIVLSKSPLVQFTEHLDYLVQYPHGCMEQTISAAFPQLYYGDMCIALYKGSNKSLNPNANIEEALKKIKLCQTYNGGLTMWSGGGEVNWWATTYASHFMIEAKKAGFEIDEACLDRMLGYIKMKLKNKETITYYYNRTLNKKTAPQEVAYSLYVLALAGKPESSIMSYYKSSPALLTSDAKYLLAATYFIAGDKTKYREILPGSFGDEQSVTQDGGSFYSAIRDKAIALNALIEINVNDPQVAIIAKQLSTEMKANKYLSTQERAWAFLAMGKIAKLTKSSTVTADVSSGGKNIGTYKDGMLTINKNQLVNNQISVSTKGSGALYYFVESEGISSTGAYKEEDNFLQVRKTFYDRYGRQITDLSFKQNDIVVIKITLKASSGFVDNVVVTDMLPAGFEIENPRINDVPGTSWVKDDAYAMHTDIRDDRINLFVSASANSQSFYYAVRCVSKGTFRMGPVSADAMYNGEYHSYNGAGTVRIK
jgi:uncharacterized protein YfaS (alpha-2-macroglobulin family)